MEYDGYRNFREHALPLLTEFGFKATIFVPVDYVGKRPLWLERDLALTRPLIAAARCVGGWLNRLRSDGEAGSKRTRLPGRAMRRSIPGGLLGAGP